MSIEIQEWTFGEETDRGIISDRFAITRKFVWGNDWQKIYVGFLISKEDDWPLANDNVQGKFGLISSDGTTYQDAQYAVVTNGYKYCYYTSDSFFLVYNDASGQTYFEFCQNGSVITTFTKTINMSLLLRATERSPLVWKFERAQDGFYFGFLKLSNNSSKDINFSDLMEAIDYGDEDYIVSNTNSSAFYTYGPFTLPDGVILDALHYYHYYPDRRLRILGAFASKWA